jgi:hypothetical protein
MNTRTSATHLRIGDTVPADLLERSNARPLGAPKGDGVVTGTWDTKRGCGYTVEMPGYGEGGKFVFSVFRDTLDCGR